MVFSEYCEILKNNFFYRTSLLLVSVTGRKSPDDNKLITKITKIRIDNKLITKITKIQTTTTNNNQLPLQKNYNKIKIVTLYIIRIL